MRRTSILSTLALLAATALVVPVFGKPFEKNVTFGNSVKVGSTQLDAGDYKVLVDGNKVTIEEGKKVVAQTQGHMEQRDQRYDTTAVITTSNGEIQEIDFGGQNQALVLNP
jgi:hypothetical protein